MLIGSTLLGLFALVTGFLLMRKEKAAAVHSTLRTALIVLLALLGLLALTFAFAVGSCVFGSSGHW